ncbi:hypothetical protein BY458DRAFT_507106 [Sporodiniella umbellata]|nr:hypothetical protein BY458DRAFT_507106 [Sporodiniella umbellata]
MNPIWFPSCFLALVHVIHSHECPPSLSKREQKKWFMLADLADLEPITLASNSGRNYCLLGNATNINNVLRNQPVGNWELPLENSELSIDSPTASQSNALNHIIKTSPFYKHLSNTKYVELSKSTVKMISKDWIQFPQLRYAIPQLFSGAVITDEYAALLVNGLEPYGRLRIVDAHFERRTKSTLSQSSFPKKETKYGWIKTVAVEDDNTTKLKIGLLTCNLLITSSLRIDNHASTTNGAVELGSNTDNSFPKENVLIYLNEESIKFANTINENKGTTSINSWDYLSQLRQLRSKFHCMPTYTLCRSFSSLSTDMSFQPYAIWTLYNYDSNQSLDSQSQKLSLMFQSIALAVITDGANARVEMKTFRSLYVQLNDNKIKETTKQILDMEQGQSIFIINNIELSQNYKN